MNGTTRLDQLAKLVRYYILLCTNAAGSGHATSSLSAADLMTVLFFGGFYRFDPDRPALPNNDRLVFSKGHASPLLYALWAAAGRLDEAELEALREFGSTLEGHPTPRFRYADVATGSLGQGLSIGAGMALNARYLDKLPYRTFVLLGDGEMAEGSQWEALQLAARYRLDNLVGIVDVNRLGQSGETMYGRDLLAYKRRVEAFGWEAFLVEDGHDAAEIAAAYARALDGGSKPKMILARTVKGKGVPSAEDRDGFHGKALGPEAMEEALSAFGPVDRAVRGELAPPQDLRPRRHAPPPPPARPPRKETGSKATREAYGEALVELADSLPGLVALDGEVSNSTGSDALARARPQRFFEMYIAEQNMAGMAVGLSARGKRPFVSTFAAFFARAFDQIRMAQYSRVDAVFCGSHAGVSIGQDGPSQMGLEDIALFRTLQGSAVLYPCDAVSARKLTEEAARRRGLVYLRTTREKTPVLYSEAEEFPIGGHKVLRRSGSDAVALAAAGICVFEALKAAGQLEKDGVAARVIDLYSVKPLDGEALRRSLEGVKGVVVAEDHRPEGGIAEAVRSALEGSGLPVRSLAVTLTPRSGKPADLLDFEEISAPWIARAARDLLAGRAPRRRPSGLRTRIFLDGGDPAETREALRLLGFLDGQTTNPSLVAKNPGVRERLARGLKFRADSLLERYRSVVAEVSELVPDGSVSVEVYADALTTAEEMLRQGREMASWIPNAHVKLPCTEAGLTAAARAAAEGLRVNMTLCFTQDQAAAVYAATRGAKRGDVFVSPFIGRLDDAGADGMALVEAILRMYRGGDGHVETLAASVRSVEHLLEAFRLDADIVTAPFSVLKEWAERGLPLTGGRAPDRGLKAAPYKRLDLSRDWREFDLRHPLTDKGQEHFAADWNALLERPAEARG